MYAALVVSRRVVEKARWLTLPDDTRRVFATAGEAHVFFMGAGDDVPTSFDDWWDSLTPATNLRTWQVELVTGEGTEEIVYDDATDWRWGYPIPFVLPLLDRLEGEGWSVMHISEDRGLYAGPDAPTDSFLTRVRYLLHRAA